jgi:hypothetical protein
MALPKNEIIKLSDAVAKLLDQDNKNKSLGEVSQELNDYIIEIKELVDTGDITYDELKEEIKTLPNSLAQLLMGCVGGTDSCPMKKESPEDIPFAYDNKTKKLIPMSKFTSPLTEDTYAVIYISGDPRNVSVESLRDLEIAGFKKLRIEYKGIEQSSYKTINIDNLKRYIYSKPEKDSNVGIVVMVFIVMVALILFYNMKN